MGSGTRKVNINSEEANKFVKGMPSYAPSLPSSSSMGIEGTTVHPSRISEFGNLDQSAGFRLEDAINLSRNTVYNHVRSNIQGLGADVQFGALSKSVATSNVNLFANIAGSQTLPLQKDMPPNLASTSAGQRENWGESSMADASPMTDTSTDDTDDKNQRTLRRLAQNREAARKSRLKKKAYVQQLESSRLKLTQLEQELQQARQQGVFVSSTGDQTHSMSGNGIQ